MADQDVPSDDEELLGVPAGMVYGQWLLIRVHDQKYHSGRPFIAIRGGNRESQAEVYRALGPCCWLAIVSPYDIAAMEAADLILLIGTQDPAVGSLLAKTVLLGPNPVTEQQRQYALRLRYLDFVSWPTTPEDWVDLVKRYLQQLGNHQLKVMFCDGHGEGEL